MNLLNGSNFLIWIDENTPRSAGRGLDYRPVVCGTSNGFSMSAESISLRNKDDGGFDDSTPGYISSGFDLDGYAVGLKKADKLAKANFQVLAELFINKKEFWVKQEDLETSITREAFCWIQDFKETANQNTPYSFNCQFVVKGKPILEENIFKTVLATDTLANELVQDGNNNLINTKDGD